MTKATPRHKFLLFVLFSAAYFALYIIPNFHPPFHPAFLPLLHIDEAVPFLPWTFVVYLSLYVLELLTILLHRDADQFNAFGRMAFATLFVCGLFFIFFPTQYPRPIYPEVSNSFVACLMHWVSQADMPTNCFPSMHVATTSIATWSLRHKGRGLFFGFALWSIAIFVSTLTTKQHYFIDIVGGLTVASTVAALDWLLFEREVLRLSAARAWFR